MPNGRTVRVAICGAGNCASSLVQGVRYYADTDPGETIPGLMHVVIDGYHVKDIEFVAAFDVAHNKVGVDLATALDAPPNNTICFQPLPKLGVNVLRGPTLDGLSSSHMQKVVQESTERPVDVARALKDAAVDVVINYLPVGSDAASVFYAEQALEAGCAFVNCIPCFIASNLVFAKRFRDANLPIIGDDVKSQVGATIIHRVLARLFEQRGVRVDETFQLNVGGNMDFCNMLDRSRLDSKKVSKTEAVQSQLGVPLPPGRIHVGPSDYVQFLDDKKLCFIRLHGTGFGGVPIQLRLELEVWDSPNSAGVVIDAVRIAKMAKDRGYGGPILSACAALMKHPPKQMPDEVARRVLEDLIHMVGNL
jgi:myo-inositol-1-phosphate synthase